MSVKNFKFVSPGVFVNEIDNSQLPASPAGIGPVVIGRAEKGPSLRPVTVNSFSEFVEVFGAPIPGNAVGDVWRQGSNVSAPSYGAYGAQAYLRNSAPLTYVRLLGAQDANNDGSGGKAGFDGGLGDAWGLVVFQAPSSSTSTDNAEGVLAAVFYTTKAASLLQLSGALAEAGTTVDHSASIATTSFNLTGSNIVVQDTGKALEFKMIIHNSDYSGKSKTTVFNFDINDSKYIRKVFNTTPQRTNSGIVENELNYWLGETFDRHLSANITAGNSSTYAAIVNINSAVSSLGAGDDFRAGLQRA